MSEDQQKIKELERLVRDLTEYPNFLVDELGAQHCAYCNTRISHKFPTLHLTTCPTFRAAQLLEQGVSEDGA